MHKVSIIVPCYNQAQYLDDCLQSVLDQTYQDWECIIVNDGSPDNTAIIASVWTARDPRFKYIYKENGGLSSARNAGRPTVSNTRSGTRSCGRARKDSGMSPSACCPRASMAPATASKRSVA